MYDGHVLNGPACLALLKDDIARLAKADPGGVVRVENGVM